MSKVNYQELKKGGFLQQRQENMFIMRLRTKSGSLTGKQLRHLAALSEKYGRGEVHVTTRQGVEIPFVTLEHFNKIQQEIKELGLTPGTCGPRIRAVVACPGTSVCRQGLLNAREMGEKLDQMFFGREVPMKTKIAVSGCPNSCAKPQENDLGFVGAVEPAFAEDLCTGCGLCAKVCPARAITIGPDRKPVLDKDKCIYEGNCIASCPTNAWTAKRTGYTAYAGGKIGRFPRLADQVGWFLSEEDVPRAAEAILSVFAQLHQPGERIADVMDRVGAGTFISLFNEYRQEAEGRKNNG